MPTLEKNLDKAIKESGQNLIDSIKQSTESTAPKQAEQKPVPPTLEQRFGSGKYFAIQCEVFKDTKRLFNIEEPVAEKIAKAIATALGAIFSNGKITITGLDKLNKDGKLKSIKEVSALKNLPLTNEVSMLRAITYCNAATSNHVKGVFQLDDTLEDWVLGFNS